LRDLGADQRTDLMYGFLEAGERKAPELGRASGAIAESLEGPQFLSASDDNLTVDDTDVSTVPAETGVLANDTFTRAIDQTNLTLDFDANFDTNDNGTWEQNLTSTNEGSFTWAGSGFSHVDDAGSSLPGITSAFQFTNGNTASMASLHGFDAGDGDVTTLDASFELWVRPETNNATATLFETGGTTDGMTIYLEDGFVNMEARDNGGGGTVTSSSRIMSDEFTQIVGTIEFDGSGGGTLTLHLDGVQAGSTTIASNFVDWAGSSGASLGNASNGPSVSGKGDFQGQIHAMRFYQNRVVTESEAQAAYDTIARPLQVTQVQGSGASVGSAATTDQGGTVTVNVDGSFTYDPSGVSGSSDSFTYTVEDVSDPSSPTSQQTVNLTLVANAAPTAGADADSVAESSTLDLATSDLLSNDSDADANNNVDPPILVSFDGTSANGGTIIRSNNSLRYDTNGQFEALNAGESATDTFSYTISDGITESTGTVTLTVNGENDDPVANADNDSTDEDTAITIDITGNDTDVESQDIEVDSVDTAVTSGSVSINPDNDTVQYDPTAAFQNLRAGETATDTFDVTVIDGNGGSASATVTVTVTGVNDGPTANDDSPSTDEATDIDVDVTLNDTDADDAESLQVIEVRDSAGNLVPFDTTTALPSGATVNVSQALQDFAVAGTVSDLDHTPKIIDVGSKFTNPVVITSSVDSSGADPDTAVARVTEVDNSGATTQFTVRIGEPELHDIDGDGTDNATANNQTHSEMRTISYLVIEAGSWELEDGTRIEAGTSDISSFGVSTTAVNFSANAGFFTETPTVLSTIQTGNNLQTDGVTPDLWAHTRMDSQSTTGFGVALESFSGSALSVAETVGWLAIERGTGAFDGNAFESTAIPTGTIDATQSAAFTQSFTSAPLLFTQLSTTAGADPMVMRNSNVTAGGFDYIGDEDTAADEETGHVAEAVDFLAIQAGGTLQAFDAASVGSGSAAGLTGTLNYDPNGSFEFLGGGDSTTDTLTYVVEDKDGATSTATVTITIDGLNDAPTATDDTFDVAQGIGGSVVLGNVIEGGGPNAADSDPDNDVLNVASYDDLVDPGEATPAGSAVTPGTEITTNKGGKVTINALGELSYDPTGVTGTAGSTVVDKITYQVTDDDGSPLTDSGTITINVTIADPPAAQDDGYSIDENGPLTVDGASGLDSLLDNDGIPVGGQADLYVDIGGSDVTSALGATIQYTEGGTPGQGNGEFVYRPADSAILQTLGPGESLDDTFTYQVKDGTGTPNTATVTVTVTGDNTIEVNTNLLLPSSFTGDREVNDDAVPDTVDISQSGRDLTLSVNGETLRTVDLSALTVPADLSILTSGDEDTVNIGALSDANLKSLTVDAAGGLDTINITGALDLPNGVDLAAESIHLGGDVTTGTSGDQTYNGDVVLESTLTLTGANVNFEQAIDSADGQEHGLTVNLNNASGRTSIKGLVGQSSAGGASRLGSLTTGSLGTTQFRADAIPNSSNLVFNWDAALDTAGDGVWDSVLNAETDDEITFTNVSSATPEEVSDATFAALSKAYRFGAGGIADGATVESWDSFDVGNQTTSDHTFEIVIRPDDLTGKHVLWESGGTGVGTVLTLEEDGSGGAFLRLETRDGTDNFVEHQLTPGSNYEPGDWIHIAAVMDISNDQLRLYVNGTENVTDFVDDGGAPLDLTDWSGSGDAGIANENGATPATDTAAATDGGTGETGPGFSPTTFNGQIAAIRSYGIAFDQTAANDAVTFLQTQQAPVVAVDTSGAQSFGNAVELTQQTVLNGMSVTFSSAVDDDGNPGTPSTLEITTSGNTVFDGAVGSSQRVSSLDVTAAVIEINGGSVATDTDQIYNGPVQTAAVATDLSSLGWNLDFQSTLTTNGEFTISDSVDATVAGAVSLVADATFHASNDVEFEDTVTGTTSNLTVQAQRFLLFTGAVDVNALNTSDPAGTAAGRTEFRDAVTLRGTGGAGSVLDQQVTIAGDITISAHAGGDGDLVFGRSLESVNGTNHNLSIAVNGGSNLEFRAGVGAGGETNSSDPGGFGDLNLTGTGSLTIANDESGAFLPGLDEVPFLNFVAGKGADTGDSVWENIVNSAGAAETLALAVGGTFVPNPPSIRSGIHGAYATTATGPSLHDLPKNLSDENVTVELWFKDTAGFTGDKVLWETGGNNTAGASLVLRDSLLTLSARESGSTGTDQGSEISVDLAAILSETERNDFNQVMMVYNRGGGSGSQTNDTIALYVNGQNVGSAGNLNIDDIANGDDTGLGQQNGSTCGFPYEDGTSQVTSPFDGEFAIYRVYREALNDGQVEDAFNVVDNPTRVVTSGPLNVGLTGGVSLETSTRFEAAGDLSLDSAVDGDHELALRSGATVSVNNSLGSATALDGLEAQAGSMLTLNGEQIAVQGDHDVILAGPVDVTADLSITHSGAGDVVFPSTVDSSTGSNLTVSTQAGQKSVFRADVGSANPLGDLTTDGAEFGAVKPPDLSGIGTTPFIDLDPINLGVFDLTLPNAGTGGSAFDGSLPDRSALVDADSAFPGIDRAVEFRGSGPAQTDGFAMNLESLNGNGDTQPVTFELWVKPASLDVGDGQILFESGGGTTGTNVSLVNSLTDPGNALDVLFTVQENPNQDHIELRSSTSITSTDEFTHIVATYDPTNAGVTNDPTAITIDDVSVNEADGTATFTATLNRATTNDFSVDVVVSEGSATAGTDFTASATPAQLSFTGTANGGADNQTATFDVSITDDSGSPVPEIDENFFVSLTNLDFGANPAEEVEISDGAQATIVDDDGFAGPQVAIGDVSVDEDFGAAQFTATLTGADTFVEFAEVGSVTVPASSDATVTLNREYVNPVVILGGVSNDESGDDSPATANLVRVNQTAASPTEFTLNLAEPTGTAHQADRVVSYIVVEAGTRPWNGMTPSRPTISWCFRTKIPRTTRK